MATWKSRLLRYGAPAAGAALLAGLWLCASPASKGPSPGDLAPELSLADLSGRTVTLGERRGRVVLLDFWATWCDTCIEEAPNLKTLQARMTGRDFELLAVSVDERPQAVAEFAAKERLPYRVLFAEPEAARAYGVWMLPTKFLLDRDGRVARRYAGGTDFREIESDIIRLLDRRNS